MTERQFHWSPTGLRRKRALRFTASIRIPHNQRIRAHGRPRSGLCGCRNYMQQTIERAKSAVASVPRRGIHPESIMTVPGGGPGLPNTLVASTPGRQDLGVSTVQRLLLHFGETIYTVHYPYRYIITGYHRFQQAAFRTCLNPAFIEASVRLRQLGSFGFR
jgi:hypothetical protein